MDSLEAVPVPDEQETLLAGNPELAQDFRLRYALGVEMPGSACLLGEEFRDPFAHAHSVVRGGYARRSGLTCLRHSTGSLACAWKRAVESIVC